MRLIPLFLIAEAAFAQSPTAWAKAHAIPLKTVEAGHGFDDMQPLKKVVGDAQIVQLGEATHGTREFFQLKHRMLEFLATELGFNIFSIEANMPEAYRLNEYVLNGTGDPSALIRGMYFWTWDTEEVLDMVRWMRAFNESGKGPVQFTGFDSQTPQVAAEIVRAFAAKNDPGYELKLRDAIKLASIAAAPPPEFGSATGMLPVSDFAGHTARFSGWLKTEDAKGEANLWFRVDDHGKVAAFQNLKTAAPKGTSDWQHFSLEIPVVATANNINFGMLLSGPGKAWFDDLALEIDGKPYSNPTFDFSFESPALKGFLGTAQAFYRIAIDKNVFHNGAQSLLMERTSPMPDPAGVDSREAAAVAWDKVVGYLETFRESYLNKGASPRDIDWAIQNARVVSQAMQMKSNPGVRDKSMATNIRWIADQNQGSKIVVWAHNGHVGKSVSMFPPMGQFLQELFPGKVVTFGFAFNQGGFQAIETGKGKRNFTVPPMVPGSLDATLAATGIPVFALDLRDAPAWYSEAHKSRSIGAVFSDAMAANLVVDLQSKATFDALLFVEKTTAAKPIQH